MLLDGTVIALFILTQQQDRKYTHNMGCKTCGTFSYQHRVPARVMTRGREGQTGREKRGRCFPIEIWCCVWHPALLIYSGSLTERAPWSTETRTARQCVLGDGAVNSGGGD